MKKVLFATTALVASAGFAMAQEVALSGSAEMGIFGADNGSDNDEPLQFHTDIDVTFTMTGETDTGLAFGAAIDLDDAVIEEGDDNAFDADVQDGEEVFISGTFGTLTMGDTDGAFDWALSEAIIGSSLQDDHEHVGYNGNAGLDGLYDGQIARYEYNFGDFGVALSAEIDDADDPELEDDAGDPVIGIGATYDASFGFAGGLDVGFGIGAQTVADVDQDFDELLDDDNILDYTVIGLSASTEIVGVEVILNYSTVETDLNTDEDDLDDVGDDFGDGEHYGIALGYSFDALTIAANYGEFDDYGVGDQLVDNPDGRGVGLIANYDLGGGAELQAGVGFNDPDGEGDLFGDDDDEDDDDTFTTYSFGISMSF